MDLKREEGRKDTAYESRFYLLGIVVVTFQGDRLGLEELVTIGLVTHFIALGQRRCRTLLDSVTRSIANIVYRQREAINID